MPRFPKPFKALTKKHLLELWILAQDAGFSYLVFAGLKPLDADLDAQAGELLLVAVRHGDITPIYM